MNKFHLSIKKTVIVLATIIIFIILTLISLSYIINPNNYKSLIEEKFYKATGRFLVINGPISLSLFPNIHIIAKQVAITNPIQLSKGNFVELPLIDISIQTLPLIKGTIHFNNIELEGLKLNLVKNKKLNNWNFSNADTLNPKLKKSSINFVINKVSLINLQLKYVELEKPKIYATKIFNLLINQKNGEIILDNNGVEFNNTSINFNKNLLSTLNFKINSEPKIYYKGKFSIWIESLTNLMNTLNFETPRRLKFFTHTIKMSSDFTGTNTSYDFNHLQLKLDDTEIKGNISIGVNPYLINSDLRINKINLQNFVNLQGFKLKIESISILEKFSTESENKFSTLNGQGMIKTGIITLYGLDIKKFSQGTTKVIKDISIFKRLITYTRTIATIKLLRQEIDKINGKRLKSYADKTFLGQFNGNIVANKGTLAIKECNLTGSSLKGLCSGKIFLGKDSLNFLIQGRILPQNEQTFINYIYFPYYINGRIGNLNTGLDWAYITKQATNYYKAK